MSKALVCVCACVCLCVQLNRGEITHNSFPTLSLCEQLLPFDVIMSGRHRERLGGRETANFCNRERKKEEY